MNEIAVIEPRAPALTAKQVKGRVQLIQEVMESVMKEGVHYGVIPGTDKPSLLKAGAEVLCMTFRIAVNPQIEDLSTSDEIRYRIRCIGTHQGDGTVVGAGIGECSSNEEKYKWKRSNRREFDATPEDRRRIKYGYDKRERKEYEVQQVRTEPADVANTVLKMAKKRALVDFTLTALAASDIFNQDIEDIPDEILDSGTEPQQPKVEMPKAKKEEPKVDPNQKLAPGQIKVLQRALDKAGMSAADLCQHYSISALTELPFTKINEALKYVSEKTLE